MHTFIHLVIVVADAGAAFSSYCCWTISFYRSIVLSEFSWLFHSLIPLIPFFYDRLYIHVYTYVTPIPTNFILRFIWPVLTCIDSKMGKLIKKELWAGWRYFIHALLYFYMHIAYTSKQKTAECKIRRKTVHCAGRKDTENCNHQRQTKLVVSTLSIVTLMLKYHKWLEDNMDYYTLVCHKLSLCPTPMQHKWKCLICLFAVSFSVTLFSALCQTREYTQCVLHTHTLTLAHIYRCWHIKKWHTIRRKQSLTVERHSSLNVAQNEMEGLFYY